MELPKRIPMLDEIRFWQQVATDAERTILCSPELESRLKTMIRARGLENILTVQPTPLVPDREVWVIDEQALRAQAAKSPFYSSLGDSPQAP